MKAIGPGSATRRTAVFMGCLALIFSLSMIGCTKKDVPKPTIVFADPGWDSGQVHARVAAFIVKNGMGYDVDFIPGETIPLFQGLARGDIDISMEIWYENQKEAVDKAEAEGKVIDLGDNFPDSWQGWLVPTYVIKGDPARGIEPMAPDLKSVYDLPQYKDVFKDVEDPGKGRFYSCISGWECEKINEKKFAAYGLDDSFNLFLPGSGAALVTSLAAAYKKGEPWVGYYWAPTWVLGVYDMTPLEEPPYNKDVFDSTAKCAYPAVAVKIYANAKLPNKAPEIVEFLKKYETTQAMANKFLAFMQESQADTDAAAMWFLKNYESIWTGWVPEDVASKVRKALN